MGYFDQFESYQPQANNAQNNTSYFDQFESYTQDNNSLAQSNVITQKDNAPSLNQTVQAPVNNTITNATPIKQNSGWQNIGNAISNATKDLREHPIKTIGKSAKDLFLGLGQQVTDNFKNSWNNGLSSIPGNISSFAQGAADIIPQLVGGLAKGSASLVNQYNGTQMDERWNQPSAEKYTVDNFKQYLEDVNNENTNPISAAWNMTPKSLEDLSRFGAMITGNDYGNKVANTLNEQKEQYPLADFAGSMIAPIGAIGAGANASKAARLANAAEKAKSLGKLEKAKILEQQSKLASKKEALVALNKSGMLGGAFGTLGDYDNAEEMLQGIGNGYLAGNIIHGAVGGTKFAYNKAKPYIKDASYKILPKETQDNIKQYAEDYSKLGKIIEKVNAKSADLLTEEDIQYLKNIGLTEQEVSKFSDAVRRGVVLDQGEVLDAVKNIKEYEDSKKKGQTVTRSQEYADEFFENKEKRDQREAKQFFDNLLKEESKPEETRAVKTETIEPDVLPEYKQTSENTIEQSKAKPWNTEKLPHLTAEEAEQANIKAQQDRWNNRRQEKAQVADANIEPDTLPEYKQTQENTIQTKDDLSPVKSEPDINTPNDIKTLENEPLNKPQDENIKLDFNLSKSQSMKHEIKAGIEHPSVKMDESKVTKLESGVAEGVEEGNKDLYTLRTRPQRNTNSLDSDNYVTESPQEQIANDIKYNEKGGEVDLKEWNKDLAPEDSWSLNKEIEVAEKTVTNKLKDNEQALKFINAKAKKEFGVDKLLNTAESPALQKALSNPNKKFAITSFVKQLCKMPQSKQTARALQVLDMNAPQSIKNIIQAEMKKNNLNYDMSSVKYSNKEARIKSKNLDTPQNRTKESRNHIISKASVLKEKFVDRVQDINNAVTEFIGYLNKATDSYNAKDFLARNKELHDYFTPAERGMLGESNIVFVDKLGDKGKASNAIYDVVVKNLEADGVTKRTKESLFETIRHELRHICDFRTLDKLKNDNPIKKFIGKYNEEYQNAKTELNTLEQQAGKIFADGLLKNENAFKEIGGKIVDNSLTLDNVDYYKNIVDNEFGKGSDEAKLFNKYLDDWATYYSHPLESRAFQASKGIKVTGDLIDELTRFFTRRYGTEFITDMSGFGLRPSNGQNAGNISGVRGSKTEVQGVLHESSKRSRGEEELPESQVAKTDGQNKESVQEEVKLDLGDDRYDEHGNLKRGSFFDAETPDFTKQDPLSWYDKLPENHKKTLNDLLGEKVAKIYSKAVDITQSTEDILTNKLKVLNDGRRFNELVNEYASTVFEKRIEDLTPKERTMAKTNVEAMMISEGAKENLYSKVLPSGEGSDSLHWFTKEKQDALFGSKKGYTKAITDVKKFMADIMVRQKRYDAINEMVDFAVKHFGKPIEMTGKFDIKDVALYEPVNPDLLKMTAFKGGSKSMYKTMMNGADAIKKAFNGENMMNEMLALYNDAGVAKVMLPKYVVNALFNNSGESLKMRGKRYGKLELAKGSIGAVLDVRNHFFKRRVLGLSPRWFVGNRIGNYLMMTKDYDNPLEFAKDFVSAMKLADDRLPSGVLDSNILDAAETVKTTQKFTGYKPIDDAINLLSGKLYDIQELRSMKTSLQKTIGLINTKISNKKVFEDKLKEVNSAIVKASLSNAAATVPHLVDKLINFNFKVNDAFEKHERKMIYLNKSRKAYKENAVDKKEIKRVGSNIIKQTEILDWMDKNPKAKAEVKEEIFRTLGDYNNLTNIERGLTRRAIPFVKWIKAITRNTAGYVKNSPEKAAILLYELKRFVDSNADKADWQKFSIDLGNGYIINLDRLLPHNTIKEMGDAGDILNMLNPAIKESIEVTAKGGRKLFHNSEIKNSRYTDDKYYVKDNQRDKYIAQRRMFDRKKQEYVKDKNGEYKTTLPITTRAGYVGTQWINDMYPIMENNLVSAPEVVSAFINKGMPMQGKYDVGWGRFNDGDSVDDRVGIKKSQRADKRKVTEYDLPQYLAKKVIPVQKAIYKNPDRMTPEEKEKYYKMIEKAQKAKKGKLYW